MSEMVERVARALAQADREDWQAKSHDPHRWARAAIAEMREPTETMLEAGESKVAGKDMWLCDCWRAMIDAALDA